MTDYTWLSVNQYKSLVAWMFFAYFQFSVSSRSISLARDYMTENRDNIFIRALVAGVVWGVLYGMLGISYYLFFDTQRSAFDVESYTIYLAVITLALSKVWFPIFVWELDYDSYDDEGKLVDADEKKRRKFEKIRGKKWLSAAVSILLMFMAMAVVITAGVEYSDEDAPGFTYPWYHIITWSLYIVWLVMAALINTCWA